MLGDLLTSAVKCEERKQMLTEPQIQDKKALNEYIRELAGANKIRTSIICKMASPTRTEHHDVFRFNITSQEFETAHKDSHRAFKPIKVILPPLQDQMLSRESFEMNFKQLKV